MSKNPDFNALSSASPHPYRLLSAPELTIIGANPAYLRKVERTVDGIVGRTVLLLFLVGFARCLQEKMPDSLRLRNRGSNSTAETRFGLGLTTVF